MPAVRTTPSVRWLLIFSVGAFLVQLICDQFAGTHLLRTFSLIPLYVVDKHAVWQLGTYMFMHTDMFHVLFNMLMLWMFGSELEGQWGAKFFLKYFFVCGLSSGLLYVLLEMALRGVETAPPVLGANAAVFGLLVAYGILYSERTILFMMVFPMKTKHMVMILAAIEFVSTVVYGGVANAVHLAGMLTGFLYLFLNAWLRIRAKRKTSGGGRRTRFRRSHLRLVVNNEVLREFDDDEDADGGDEGSSGPGRPTFH